MNKINPFEEPVVYNLSSATLRGISKGIQRSAFSSEDGPTSRVVQEAEQDEIRLSEAIFDGMRQCTIAEEGALLDPSNSNAKTLAQSIQENYNDPETMRAAWCAIGGLLNIQSKQTNKNENEKLLDKLSEALTDVKQIGAASAAGRAFVSGVWNSTPIMIAKVPRRPNAVLQHELTVGFLLNGLRFSGCPNFAMLYWKFSCAPPVEGGTHFCPLNRKSPSVLHVVYEAISPSKSIEESIPTWASADNKLEFWLAVLQTLLAVEHANKVYGFTHFDLHTENVLWRQAPRDARPIVYDRSLVGRAPITLPSAFGVATIIDYGTSDIRFENFKLPLRGVVMAELGVPANGKSFPLSDGFKFLMFCARALREVGWKSESKTLDNVMLKAFGLQPERVEELLEELWPLRYVLPPIDALLGGDPFSKLIDVLVELTSKLLQELLI